MLSSSSKLCPTTLVQKEEVSDNTPMPGHMQMSSTAVSEVSTQSEVA